MTLLNRNTTPAERARGCVFSELFRDGESIARNGGTVTGTPAIDKGITLNGITDYVGYDLDVGGFYSDGALSFVIGFLPNFAIDDSTRHIIFDCSSTILSLSKRENNALWVTAGGAPVINVPLANYQSYWLVGQKNILVYSGISGVNNCWLNGNLIATTVTAYSVYSATEMAIGASITGTYLAACTVYDLKIFNRLLTADEAADFYNGGIYSYRNEPSLNLPFGMAQHDPTNTRSLDVSGNARHATLVNTPAKLGDRPGYDFNGSTQYMTVVGTGVFNAAGVTIAIEFTPDFLPSIDASIFLFNDNSAAYYIRKKANGGSNELLVVLGGTSIVDISEATYSPYWFKKGKNVLIVSGTTGDISVWLNGNKIVSSDNTAWTQTDVTTMTIGATGGGGSSWFDGKIHSFKVWREALTPLQVADLC